MKVIYIIGTLVIIAMAIAFVGIMDWNKTHRGNELPKNAETIEVVDKSQYDSLRIKDSILLVNCEMQSRKKDTIVNNVSILLAAYETEKALNKKLKDSLFQQNWRIVKAKHYIKIVQKNPHDLGFLVGWLNNQCFN